MYLYALKASKLGEKNRQILMSKKWFFSVVILHYVPTIISSPRKGHTVRFDVATSTLCYTNISLGNHTVFAEDFHLFIFYFFSTFTIV